MKIRTRKWSIRKGRFTPLPTTSWQSVEEGLIFAKGMQSGHCAPACHYVQNDPVNLVDPDGLAPFTNNCNKPVCFKPEKTKDGYDGTKKYEYLPGQTCDADGVYPPDGSNPIKFCDNCSIKSTGNNDECKIEKPDCPSNIAKICQLLRGGKRSDKWMNKHKEWPKSSDLITKNPKKD